MISDEGVSGNEDEPDEEGRGEELAKDQDWLDEDNGALGGQEIEGLIDMTNEML